LAIAVPGLPATDEKLPFTLIAMLKVQPVYLQLETKCLDSDFVND
jgi:hypothetical protein